ncbi:glutathione S-transferase family protein [Granulosicoccaceae sp. 1_MG-2023]|nr:glutathione S-transferase family protein [Granulosicoccaceae sp. 1_MG-2023]
MNQTNPHKLELISFKICPYVQRSVIALKQKNVDFDLTYVDLADLPDWFHEISPLGKVPVLKVDDTAIFESAVISEFLDETYAPPLHPAAALTRAHHRAWIEFGSELIGTQFRMLIADNEAAYEESLQALKDGLAKLEAAADPQGPYFSGSALALIDTAYAPLFMRLAIVNKQRDTGILKPGSRLAAWADALLALESVQQSVVDDFEALFTQFFRAKGSFVLS